MKHCIPKPLWASRFLFSIQRLLWLRPRLSVPFAGGIACGLAAAAFGARPQGLAPALHQQTALFSRLRRPPPCPARRSLPPGPAELLPPRPAYLSWGSRRCLLTFQNHSALVKVYDTWKLACWVIWKSGNPLKKRIWDCVITKFLNNSNEFQLSKIKRSTDGEGGWEKAL